MNDNMHWEARDGSVQRLALLSWPSVHVTREKLANTHDTCLFQEGQIYSHFVRIMEIIYGVEYISSPHPKIYPLLLTY